MFSKVKLIIGLVSVILVGLGVWLNPYTITKKSVLKKYEKRIKDDSTSIAKINIELEAEKTKNFSIQQDLDICENNKTNHQIVNDKLTKERNEARAEAKRNLEAIEHYEANDLIRYFVFDKQGIFKKGCYQEVFKKPDNICK